MKKILLSLLCACVGIMTVSAETTDVLTMSTFTTSSATSYKAYSDVSATSGAKYAANMASGNNSIQLRSSGNNSGIVSTTSGGTLVSVSIKWNSNTSDARTVDVYGSATAYTATTDLYDSTTQGTKIGSAKKSDGDEATINATGSYQYVGIRSNKDAMFIDEISIVWSTGEITKVFAPAITPNGGTITADTEISISSATADAEIYYAYAPKGTDVSTVEKTKYEAPFKIEASGTVAAIAKKDGLTDSDETTAEFTIPVDVTVASIAEMIELNNTIDNIIISGEVAVTYQSGKNIYAKDNTGYLCIYDADGTLSLKNGDRLTGIKGKFVKYNTGSKGSAFLPELTSIDASTFVPTDGEAVAPTEVTIEDCAADMGAAYVKISNVTIEKDSSATGTYAANYYIIKDETGSLTMYNSYGLEISEGTASVEGVLTCYQGALQLAPTNISYTEVAAPKQGDKALPYSVAEAQAKYATDNAATTGVWIKGYIVGCVETSSSPYVNEFSGDFTSQTNILIADEFDENNYDNCIPVQLSSGTSVRTNLNLKDNSDKHRALVLIYGNIDKYFNVTGFKSATSYEIVETYTETTVCRPTISPAAGEITADTEISITCATADAEIYYAYVPEGVDASTVTMAKYEAPFKLTASGSVIANAKKSGLADSKTTQVAYTIPEKVNVANIAAMIALNDASSTICITGEVAVTGQIGKNIYVKDETGYLCVYDASGTLSLNNGDRLKGITGKFAKYNTGSNGSAYLPELTSIDTATFEATAGDAVAPEVLTIAEVTDAKAAAYIQIKDATIVPDATATGSSAAKYFTITDNSGSASLYNSSSLAAISAATADAPVKGDVTGLVTVYSGALQITPLAIEVADESGVEAINGASDVAIVGIVGAISVVGYEGTVEVYNTLGQLVSATPVAGNALIPARAGLVIVKAGKTVAKVIVK